MTPDIRQLIVDMRGAIQKDPHGHLAIGWRLRLWTLMQRQSGRGARYRRNALAYLATRGILAHWHADGMDFDVEPDLAVFAFHLPPIFFAAVHSWLADGMPFRHVKQLAHHMIGLQERVPCYFRDMRMTALYPAMQELVVRFHCEDDQNYERYGWYRMASDGEKSGEIWNTAIFNPGRCDAHDFAAWAAGYTDEEHMHKRDEENVRKQRAFWFDWLDNLVPFVLQPVSDLKQSFRRIHAPILPVPKRGRCATVSNALPPTAVE